MIYLLYYQCYDDVGASLIEGPPDVDMEALKKEYIGCAQEYWTKNESPWKTRADTKFTTFESFFITWLLKEKTGFSIPEYKKFETA